MRVNGIIQHNRISKSCSDGPVLVEYCAENAQRRILLVFYAVYSVYGHLDFEKSSPLRKWYMEELSPNLCMRVKLHLHCQ
jgi:hypothetical protein